MRKVDEHQTLVHLDVHVCPVFVCVYVCVGGDSHLYIYIHKNPLKILKLKDFEPPKMVWAYYVHGVWKYQSPPPPPQIC